MNHPLLYEVNARQWLSGLRAIHGNSLDLGSVPEAELDRWRALGVSHLWLMGVWPNGPVARRESLEHPALRSAYGEALPDWKDADVTGSPYAVSGFGVSTALGGDFALARLRERLAGRGIRLVLDFVPNHLGRDHPWVRECPAHFVGAQRPFEGSFPEETHEGRRYLAHGKDPFFPGWTDTVQVEYRSAEARERMVLALEGIADQCDGVRCDMAMLVLPDVFERTWGHVPFAGRLASGCFWQEAVRRVREMHPGFLFLAEAYWGMEGRLCDAGFDYAYDKTLYDRLLHGAGWEVQAHLLGLGEQNRRRAHFLENHDEPRVSGMLEGGRLRAALLVCLGLPGMRFLHDGQVEGRRLFARIQLARRAEEACDREVLAVHERVLGALGSSAVGGNSGQVLEPWEAWAGNPTYRCFCVVLWEDGEQRDLVVVNLAPHPAQCRVRVCVGAGGWMLRDRLGPEVWKREGEAMASSGLYLDLPTYGAQVFALSRAGDRCSSAPNSL